MKDYELKIFSGNAHRGLAENIAKYVGVPLSAASVIHFPDGEISVRYEETVRGRDVFIVQPTALKPNEYLMELLIMADAARRASAARVTAVIPYFAYARQDRKDRSRVPISAKLVANLLAAAGVDRVVTMDLHAPQIQGFFDIPLDHLLAAPVLVRHIRERLPSDIVVVAPDPGSLKMAYSYSKRLHGGIALVAKQRRSATQVEALDLVGDVAGRNCVIVDDMTATAGTLCAAAQILVARGAKSVSAAVSHCPITPIGIERLKTSPIGELATTDSIPPPDFPEGTPVRVMSVAPLFGEAIKRIHGDESVSNLFEIHEGE
jgi:ribose-phosphate pyrophosphokinase